MIRTRVGYAGGTTESPTYERIGDHTETIQIDFDPQLISYERLLEVFWTRHDPTRRAFSRQYRSVILTHDARQRRLAEASQARVQRSLRREVATTIEPCPGFTRAEDYHQKYTLRRYAAIVTELKSAYPRERDFVDSTAAARLNGYLARKGTLEQLERDLPKLGLSKDLQALVRDRMRVSLPR